MVMTYIRSYRVECRYVRRKSRRFFMAVPGVLVFRSVRGAVPLVALKLSDIGDATKINETHILSQGEK